MSFGEPRRVLAACASTNDEAAAWARQGAPEGAVVIADEQSAGRGRLGRAWRSAPGEGLYLSLVLRPPLPPASAPPLTLAVGLGLLDAARALGVPAHLKWPNDLLADEPDGRRRKLAGVLTEMATQGMRLEHVVVGIGLNLATERFPPELEPIATSLHRVLGAAPPRDEVAVCVLDAIHVRYRRFLADGAPATVAAFRDATDLIGRRVTVRSGDEVVTGVVDALDDEGALHLRDHPHRIWSGTLSPPTSSE
jgi:BirA family biotin operon repressor/biotin-[acetyl-CoA-carboxylase] ligase